jgi:hypothetical protein
MPPLALLIQYFWVAAFLTLMLSVCIADESGTSSVEESYASTSQERLLESEQDLRFETASYLDSTTATSYSSRSNNYQNSSYHSVNWISGLYLKAGPTFVLGKDLLAEQLDTGYSINGGVRQPIGSGLGGNNFFLDLGGSYLSAFGEQIRTIPGEEFDTNTIPNAPNVSLGIVDDAFNLKLTEVRRGGVHCGLGYYWGPSIDNHCNDPQVRFATILGGRLSHIHGVFATDQINQIRFPPVNPPGNGDVIVPRPSDSRTDTSGGLYVNTQVILLRRNAGCGIMQFTVDGEFAHDWINLDGFKSGGLGTASILFGFLFSH